MIRFVFAPDGVMRSGSDAVVIGILAVWLSACSAPVKESATPSEGLPVVNEAELDRRLRSAAAAETAGHILVSDTNGRYWLISTLKIRAVNNCKVNLQAYSNADVATSYGFTPREVAGKLLEHSLRGGPAFVYSSSGKQLSVQTITSTEPIVVPVAALWEHCRFVGWGVDMQGQPKLPHCDAGEVLDDSHLDANGNTVYYCWKSFSDVGQ